MRHHSTLLCFLIVFGIQHSWGQEEKGVTPVNAAPPKTEPGQNQVVGETKKAAPVVAKPEVAQQYEVKSGDNPWVIAKAHDITLGELLKVNEIEDAKNLKIGDVLILPMGVESKNAPATPQLMPAGKAVAENTKSVPAAQAAAGANGEWELYTIKSGDNPWTIAKNNGLDHQQIMKLNEGLDFTKLSVGQEIKIPKK